MGIDMKRARSVLERVNKFLGILIREQLVKEAPFLDEGELEDESCLADDVWEVLNSAPRQCDVGSEEEQSRRYEAFCEVHHMQCDKGCSACPCSKKSGVSCELYWAQMPYAEEGAGE